jgi:hypothetical protein
MLADPDQRVLLKAHGLSIEWCHLTQPPGTQQQQRCRILVQIGLEGLAVIERGMRVLKVAERNRDWTGETGQGESCCAMWGVGQDSSQWKSEESWLVIKVDEI